ncbi:MAG: hypothetical protein F4164_13855 [Gemmatimonadales bacterium]|nr:hypothetical protein [Gemmatimonadales bacterium]MYG50418.1 hypothetical protein [Gemmatimonadales bacterium]MYK00606.1 hypothetical protein [Candidatus Palauibacter ramosifaciens]
MIDTAPNSGAIRNGLVATALAAMGLSAAIRVAEAQDAPRVSFGPATATFGDGLGSLRGARELEDGRVLIADGFGAAVIAWTPGSGADTLTNTGQGPQEYRTPDGLFPLPNGATLLVDLGNARLTRIEADLGFGETWPIARGAPNTGMTMMIPVGTDREGGIYFQRRLDGMAGTSDSAAVARFDPATGEIAEVGRVRLAAQTRVESGDANNRSVNIRPVPFSNQDAWNVAWDGRVAVARADGYRLEWLDSAGGVTRGPAIPYEPVRVRRADRDEWLEGLGGGLRVEATDDGSGMRMSMSRAPSGAGNADPSDFEWPDAKPVIPAGAVAVDAAGRAWVRRHVPAGEAHLYDVFDGGGQRVAQVEFPDDRRLVAFGAESAYLVRSDALGFAWLEKYPLPALPGPR